MSQNEKKAPTRKRRAVLHQLEEKRYFRYFRYLMTSRAAQPGQGMTMPGISCVGLEVACNLKTR